MTPQQIIRYKYSRIFEMLPDHLCTFEAVVALLEMQREELSKLQNNKA